MYDAKEIDAAVRNFFRFLDFDGSRQVLEDMLAHGEVEIAGIHDGHFVIRLVEDKRATH